MSQGPNDRSEGVPLIPPLGLTRGPITLTKFLLKMDPRVKPEEGSMVDGERSLWGINNR